MSGFPQSDPTGKISADAGLLWNTGKQASYLKSSSSLPFDWITAPSTDTLALIDPNKNVIDWTEGNGCGSSYIVVRQS